VLAPASKSLSNHQSGEKYMASTLSGKSMFRMNTPAFWVFVIVLGVSFFVGRSVDPVWTIEKVTLDAKIDNGELYYNYKGKRVPIPDPGLYQDSPLHPTQQEKLNQADIVTEDIVLDPGQGPGGGDLYYSLKARKHWKFWSLLPALLAVVLCWLTREPISSLFAGIVAGALLLQRYDLTDAVFVETLSTKGAAGILILYLWLLGGLMGVWSRTGATRAFAEFMAKHFVRGPRSAKLVAWFLGVLFFQGGSISTVLVGTTVKPLADKENISHEELSYIVDSTGSPIASQLAFNAWPAYVQAFIFVAGVSWLATETDRIQFFFKSVPFCFYAIFAVLGTFLLSIEKAPFLGKRMLAAIKRSRETGELDAPNAEPLSAKELMDDHTAPGYVAAAWEFILPLGLLISVAIGTFVSTGTPQVRWAFGIALIAAMLSALLKGMQLKILIEGLLTGIKGVVGGALILVLAITIGSISKETGGGLWLVEMLSTTLPYWTLPVVLQLMTILIAFSTGSSWGTYAVAFPLAMPLSWAIANSQGLAHPEFFMTICFAAVMDGSVYGDQCSPISDTTVLSSMCTGCDLMDHVRTQIPQATVAAGLASICWTVCVLFFA
jgi:Na+/H+ antiporter NhaC